MKTKLLSVIAAASIAVTSFVSLAITASAFTCNGNSLNEDDIINAGVVIESDSSFKIMLYYDGGSDWIFDDFDDEEGEHRYQLPDYYDRYRVNSADGNVLYLSGVGDMNHAPGGDSGEPGGGPGGYVLTCNGEQIELGDTLHSGDVITTPIEALWIYLNDRLIYSGDGAFTLPNTYAEYTVTNIDTDYLPGEIDLYIEEAVPVPVNEVSAEYAQVGTDYDPQFVGDTYASLWQVTVTPGDEAIESVGIKVTEKVSGNEGTVTGAIPVASGPIVFGVVVNGRRADIGTIAAIVNGNEVSPFSFVVD